MSKQLSLRAGAARASALALALVACDDGTEMAIEGAETPDASREASAPSDGERDAGTAPPDDHAADDGGAEASDADAQQPIGALDGAAVAPDATPSEAAAALDATPSALDAMPVALDATPSALDAMPVAQDATTSEPDSAMMGDGAAPDAGSPPDAAATPDSGPPICTPACGTRLCGDNGCGGSCGTCSDGQSCSAAGQCSWPARSFALDVFPVFAAAGCPGCHDASSPAAGLDLSDAASARASLVGVSATQCAPARALVAPGSPQTSYVINKLTGVGICAGLPMPRVGPPLSASQIDLVRAWIGSGAAP